MFTLHRFIVAAPRTTTSTAILPATTAILSNSIATAYTGGNNNRGNNNNNRGRNFNNNNNRNNNTSSNNTTTSSSNTSNAMTRVSSVTRNGEAFCDLSHASDNQTQGYRLIVAFPTTNCNFMDIQYAPQIREKNITMTPPAAGETPDNLLKKDGDAEAESKSSNKQQQQHMRTRIFGMPIVPLTVRLYPLQMAKVVAVLEGKSNEAVIASRLAVGTFKRNTGDGDQNGSITYAVQTRVPKPEENQPTSIEVTIAPVDAFMLEKFLSKMLIMGFDPSRDDMMRK